MDKKAKVKLVSFITQDNNNTLTRFAHIVFILENFVYDDVEYGSAIYCESASFGPFKYYEPPELADMIYSTEFHLDKLRLIDVNGKFEGTIADVMDNDKKEKTKLINSLRKLVIDYRLDEDLGKEVLIN